MQETSAISNQTEVTYNDQDQLPYKVTELNSTTNGLYYIQNGKELEVKGINNEIQPNLNRYFRLITSKNEHYVYVYYTGYPNDRIYPKPDLYLLDKGQAKPVLGFRDVALKTVHFEGDIKCYPGQKVYCVYYMPIGWNENSKKDTFVYNGYQFTTYRVEEENLIKIGQVTAPGRNTAFYSNNMNEKYFVFGRNIFFVKDNSFVEVVGINYEKMMNELGMLPKITYVHNTWFAVFDNSFDNTSLTYTLNQSIATSQPVFNNKSSVDFMNIGSSSYVTVTKVFFGFCEHDPCQTKKDYEIK